MISDVMFQLNIALLVITWLLVSLRLFTRVLVLRKPGLDDIFLLCAQAFFTAGAILYLTYGYGPTRSRSELLEKLTNALVAPILYAVENIFLHLSLGLLFLQFLVERWQRLYVYCSIGVYFSFGLIYFICLCAFRGNVDDLTEKMLSEECKASDCGKWFAIGPMSYTLAALNTFIDITFIALSIIFIWNTYLPLKNKLSIYIPVVALGSVSTVASMVRLAYINELDVTNGHFPGNVFLIATTIEQASAIACLSWSALHPLLEIKTENPLITKIMSEFKRAPCPRSSNKQMVLIDDSSIRELVVRPDKAQLPEPSGIDRTYRIDFDYDYGVDHKI